MQTICRIIYKKTLSTLCPVGKLYQFIVFFLIDIILMEASSTPKRSYPYEGIDETNPPKKYKSNTITNTTMNQEKSLLNKEFIPLAERLRPICFDDYVGQEHVIGSDTVLQQLLIKGHIPNMIFWGPPGCGKVT